MKGYKQKRRWKIIVAAVTAIVWMGLVGTASAQINVTNPTSSTVVHDNEDLTISWYQGEGVQSVDILLWSKASSSPVFYLAEDVSTGEPYYWTVPDHFPEGDYQIWVLEAGTDPINPNGLYDASPWFTIQW